MDMAEFADVGAKLVEVGQRLKQLKSERADLDKGIAEADAELQPLLVRHQQLIAELVGVPATPVAPAPTPSTLTPAQRNAPPLSPPIPTESDLEASKDRIREFLADAESGTSAHDVAAALRLDPVLVRTVMQNWVRGVP